MHASDADAVWTHTLFLSLHPLWSGIWCLDLWLASLSRHIRLIPPGTFFLHSSKAGFYGLVITFSLWRTAGSNTVSAVCKCASQYWILSFWRCCYFVISKRRKGEQNQLFLESPPQIGLCLKAVIFILFLLIYCQLTVDHRITPQPAQLGFFKMPSTYFTLNPFDRNLIHKKLEYAGVISSSWETLSLGLFFAWIIWF